LIDEDVYLDSLSISKDEAYYEMLKRIEDVGGFDEGYSVDIIKIMIEYGFNFNDIDKALKDYDTFI